MSKDLLMPLTMAALAGLAAHSATRTQPPEDLAKRAVALARATAAELGLDVEPAAEIEAPARYDVDELGELRARIEALELDTKARPAAPSSES